MNDTTKPARSRKLSPAQIRVLREIADTGRATYSGGAEFVLTRDGLIETIPYVWDADFNKVKTHALTDAGRAALAKVDDKDKAAATQANLDREAEAFAAKFLR